MWTGDVDLECATACVANGDVELHVFEKTDNVVFAFTTFHFKIDLQWTSSTDLPAKEEIAWVDQRGAR